MRAYFGIVLNFAAWAGLAQMLWAAQTPGVPPELHPWGRFRPGAWKLARVVTETFDEQGQLTGVTTSYTTTTLQAAEGNGTLVLRVEAVLEVSGKRFEVAPTLSKQGLHGETPGEKVTTSPLADGEVEIEGRKISCKIVQVEIEGRKGRSVIKTWYSASVAPYVLRRYMRTWDPDGKTLASETEMRVVALNVRCEQLPLRSQAAEVLVTTTHPKGKTVTKAITSPDVPGGVVCHTSEEFDAAGRLVRRSTLTLLDYGLTPSRKDTGLFYRLRSRGHRAYRAGTPW